MTREASSSAGRIVNYAYRRDDTLALLFISLAIAPSYRIETPSEILPPVFDLAREAPFPPVVKIGCDSA